MCETKSVLSLDLVSLLSGLMRTGKTYSAVYHLLSIKDDYHVYTNIQGLKDFNSVNVNDFLINVKILHSYYNELVSSSDSEIDIKLREKQKELGFFYYEDKEVLLVLDECQNFLGKKDSSLIFFLTYLARFKMRILFITQNPSLLDSSYTKLIIEFFSTVPLQKRLGSKHFVVRRYGSIVDLTYNKNVIENIKVPLLDCVFEKYSTPKYFSKSKSLLGSYYKYIVGGFFVLIFAFFSLYNSFSSKVIKKDSSVSSKKVFNSSSVGYISFECDLDNCYFLDRVSENISDYRKYGIIKIIDKEDLKYCGGFLKTKNYYLLNKKKESCYVEKSYYINVD